MYLFHICYFSLESEDEKESERHPKNKKITDSKEVKHLTLTATPAESRPKRKRNSEGKHSLKLFQQLLTSNP